MEKEFNYKNYGKNFKLFMEFIEMTKSGKTMEIHGLNYVVMNRKRYEEVMRKLFRSEVERFEDETN